MQDKKRQALRLHLGCGEKHLDGYVNIDFPDTEQRVIKTRADVFSDMHSLSYPEGTVDEVRSHHLFEHFSRAEALKLLVRWRTWLKPGGTLVIETPDFSTSAYFFLTAFSRRRKYQLSRHIFGSEEAGWANHKDFWDKEKFQYILGAFGFEDIKTRRYWNGISKHAKELPRGGKFFKNIPEVLYVPVLNVAGNLLPEKFYKKFGGNKMPNILVRAKKNNVAIDGDAVARETLSMYLTGKEGKELLDVWLQDFKDF